MELNNTFSITELYDNIVISTQSHKFISDDVKEIFQMVFYAVVSESISIFGSLTNIINIVCFVKQGFKDVVNISLLGLAISDLGCLVSLVWLGVCYNRAFSQLDLPFEPLEFQYLTAGWPHCIFARITSCTTAFITLERCLCITVPLKVKGILTRKRVTIIIVCMFFVLIVTMIQVYYVNRLVWKFSATRNRTIIGLTFTADREEIESVTLAFSYSFVQFSAFVTVLVCTITLVFKLRDKSKWRKTSTAAAQTDTTSSREQKVTKMVIVISTLFIACFVPVCLMSIGMIVEPELSIEGKYRNLFVVICGVGFVLESTNSASNIFIYYHMSSKYRAVFHQLFGFGRK